MNTLLLSLLLLVLIAIGLAMSRQITEGFAPLGEKQEITASPALANMLKTDIATETKKVDSLKRELDLLHAMASAPAPATEEKKTKKSKKSRNEPYDDEDYYADDYEEGDYDDNYERRPKYRRHKRCPDCPSCPDMSQYIKMDEIPCWNCTLP